MKSKTIDQCLILIGSCVINFLIAGAARLSSLLFVEFITRYDADRKYASFPFFLAFMLRNISGPLIGYLEQILGMKIVIIFGCITATFSVGACFIAENISTITVLWGVIFGLSFGLATQMIPALLNAHFPSSKNKANSIFFASASLGAIVMPLILEICLFNYGTSGSLLLLSAIIAHSIPLAFLLRDQDKTEVFKNNFDQSGRKNVGFEDSNNSNGISIYLVENDTKHVKTYKNNDAHDNDGKHVKSKIKYAKNYVEKNSKSVEIDIRHVGNVRKSSMKNANISAVNYIGKFVENNDKYAGKESNDVEQIGKYVGKDVKLNEDYKNITPKLQTADIDKRVSESKDTNQVPKKDISNIELNSISIINADNHITSQKGKSVRKKYFHSFSIFIEVIFFTLMVIHATTTAIVVILWTIILDFVRDKGVDESIEMYFVILLPISDMAGRFISGFIIDKASVTNTVMSVICCMCIALSLILFIFVNNYVLLLLLEICVSLFTGIITILLVALIHEFMEEKKRTMAMACRFLLFAPLSMLISPMIGYFREGYGSYDGVFYTMFILSVCSGLMVCSLPYLFKKQTRK